MKRREWAKLQQEKRERKQEEAKNSNVKLFGGDFVDFLLKTCSNHTERKEDEI